jgi:hypothetical protein
MAEEVVAVVVVVMVTVTSSSNFHLNIVVVVAGTEDVLISDTIGGGVVVQRALTNRSAVPCDIAITPGIMDG